MRFKILLVFVAMSVSVAHAAPNRYWAEMKRSQISSNYDGPLYSIQAVQFLLRARGYGIAADGVFGKQTENALKSFQRKRGIIASGAINGATWEALSPTLRPGARGDAVRAMQTLLGGFSDKTIKADGVYGAQTRAALLKFQSLMELKVDGIVGIDTWSRLSPGQWEGC